ncbi:MAG: glycosyltransferase [Proteobacteria bacterium]|nr:glycosyltransferase [Pseudomonadota bacterium]
MKVAYFGTYEKNYSRNIIFIEALRAVGIDVIEINEEVKEKDAKRYGKINSLIILAFKFFFAYLKLLFKLIGLKKVDGLFIGYPSHLDVIFFYPLIKLKGLKIFFNPLVSLYDTFVIDRKLFKETSLISKIIFYIDKISFKLPHTIFIDTKAHRDYLADIFNLSKDKFIIVPVGATDEFYRKVTVPKKNEFTVLYVGKYIPLHSVETIVYSAEILKTSGIRFLLVGKGQDYEKIRRIVKEKNIDNISFIDWLDRDKLSLEIASSHIVLGIFRKDGKAMRVVPNKVYDAIAGSAVVVTERSPAVLEFFNEDEIFLVEPEEPEDLADKILFIRNNYETALKVAQKGKEKLLNIASKRTIGYIIKDAIIHSENKKFVS